MATIKDVARMAGASMSTVSKYINGGNVRGEKADAIQNAINALDYRVNPFARSLKTQRSRSIGILGQNTSQERLPQSDLLLQCESRYGARQFAVPDIYRH